MAVPSVNDIIKPLLELISDGEEYQVSELVTKMADSFSLSHAERIERVISGDTRINKNVNWAIYDLNRADCLKRTKRGYVKITKRGIDILERNATVLDLKFIKRLPDYINYLRDKNKVSIVQQPEVSTLTNKTSHEILEEEYRSIQSNLSIDLLNKVKSLTPEHFENIVVKLIVAMGYGGTLQDAGQAIGRSGDGGIDGIIKEDRLGLDVIYIQAKKWDKGTIGRPEIQKFAGALAGHHAKKGIFITTADFSREAIEYSKTTEYKIILINGDALANYMIDLNVGVTVDYKYEIKKIDIDFFEEEN